MYAINLYLKKYNSMIRSILNFYLKLKLTFYSNINSEKKKILIYTDSRGFNLGNKLWKSSIRNTYSDKLMKKYSCDIHICPHKHTTFIDFLTYYEKNKFKKYDHVICHVGIVDFSPRANSNLLDLINVKRNKISDLFNEELSKQLFKSNKYNIKYEDEYTASFIDIDKIDIIYKKILQAKNLIWINSNPVINSWRGNYWKDRPKNMNVVLEIGNKLKLNNIVNLSKWDNQKIKDMTFDNIHFNSKGMNYLFKQIEKKIHEN